MTAPPGLAPATDRCPRASSGGRETLPRNLRDEVARRFMAAFPGMTGATAIRYAKAMLSDPDGFMASASSNRSTGMNHDQLARLMAELPLGLVRPRKVTPRQWAVSSS